MFRNQDVLDFQAVLETETASGREGLTVLVEFKNDIDEASASSIVINSVKHTFEVSPQVQILTRGTLAAEFERSLKAPRFIDRRQ